MQKIAAPMSIKLNCFGVMKTFVQIAAAIDLLHQHHLVHGQICTNTILIDMNVNAQLYHPITASVRDCKKKSISQFMAPELYRFENLVLANQDLDVRPTGAADVYSFGVWLYALITGTNPLAQIKPSEAEAIVAEMNRQYDEVYGENEQRHDGAKFAWGPFDMSLVSDARLRRSIRQFVVYDPEKRADLHEHLLRYYKDELVNNDVYRFVDPARDRLIKNADVPAWVRGFKRAREQIFLAVKRAHVLFNRVCTVEGYAVFRASLVQLVWERLQLGDDREVTLRGRNVTGRQLIGEEVDKFYQCKNSVLVGYAKETVREPDPLLVADMRGAIYD